jgi:hypothetical protein
MDNQCFIIMPSGEPNGYPQGHFSRVYDYVIVPACRAAGYWPLRSDATSYENPLDILKKILDSEIVICDVSAGNTYAPYGMAVRHSLDLPITVIKDTKSFITYDASSMNLVEYDESLRIDTVQKAIETIGEALKKTAENKKDRHALLTNLGIGLPAYTPSLNLETEVAPTPIADDEQEDAKAKEPRLPIISPLPDYVGDPFNEEEIGKVKMGDFLFHLNHGKGKVNFIKNAGKEKLASIQFDSGTKLLVLAVSNFYRKING